MKKTEISYEELAKEFSERVRSKIDSFAYERLTRVFGLSYQTTKVHLDCVRDRDSAAYFLPSEMRWDREQVYVNDINTNLNKMDETKLRRTACLLREIGIEENDGLVQRIKEAYPSFRYEPGTAQEAREEAREEDYGDPLVFIRELSTKLGLDLSSYEKTRTRDPNHILEGGSIYVCDFPVKKNALGEHDMCLALGYYDPDFKYRYEPDEVKSEFAEFLKGNKDIEGFKWEDFDITKHDMRIFGKYRKNVTVSLFYERILQGEKETGEWSRTAQPEATWLNEDRGYIFDRAAWNAREMGKLKLLYADIPARKTSDFRPYFHRTLEIAAGKQREQWHNPEMYLNTRAGNKDLESIIDATLDNLFTGREREELKTKIENARIKLKKSWASIPTLNLGNIKLPNPGQKNVLEDRFVVEAAPFMAEYLAHLGIMSEADAEKLIAHKLTHYFLHKSGYQRNIDRAREVVASFKENHKKAVEVA